MKNHLSRIYLFLIILSVGAFVASGTFSVSAAEKFTIVIDAGHGGKDTGAVDNELKEKDINLGVALKLGEMIRKQLKDVNVVYTRDNDSYLTLQERADKANKSKGNLFLSIHTNSVDKNNKNRTTVAGSSVYALGLHKDQNNMAVAQRENAVIELEKDYKQKYSGFDPNSDESYIIFEMAQKKNLSQSIRFADEAQKQLVATAGRRDRGVHQAGFWVLWATSMPAVLVELDFICNPNSAKYMGSEQGQKKLAEALFNAVKGYVNNFQASNSGMKNSGTKTVRTELKEDMAIATPPAPDSHRRPTSVGADGNSGRQSHKVSRRRRGDASKTASVARDVSTDSIPVRSVSRPLPVWDEDENVAVGEPELSKAELKAKQKAEAQAKKKAEAEAKRLAKEEKKKSGQHRGKISKLKAVSIVR